jgi:hypothetical protein
VSTPSAIGSATTEIQSAYTLVMYLSFFFTLMSTVSCVILLCLNVFTVTPLEKLHYLRSVGVWADFPSLTFIIGALLMAADVVLTIQVVRAQHSRAAVSRADGHAHDSTGIGQRAGSVLRRCGHRRSGKHMLPYPSYCHANRRLQDDAEDARRLGRAETPAAANRGRSYRACPRCVPVIASLFRAPCGRRLCWCETRPALEPTASTKELM